MTEAETVTGTVASTRDWKSGKGSWVNLDNNSNDFFAYKAKVPKVGETGTWKVKEGTGVMADKVELVKTVDGVDLKAVRKETADKDMEIVQKSIDSGEKTYFERQNLIIRQTCIKAAASVVGNILEKGNAFKWDTVSSNVTDVAEQLYAWVTESDQKLPEPPEEP